MRKFPLATLLFSALIFTFSSGMAAPKVAATAKAAPLVLAQNGKTSYVIALASDAIPAEKTAANQLRKYLQQITSADFSIKSEAEVAENASQILVGAGTRAGKLLASRAGSTPGVGSDGIIIKSVGDNILILSGDRPRGSLYAVFQFLEDAVGVRWWTPTENFVPRQSDLKIPAQNVVYTPPFRYREHFASSMRADPIFATILRENGHFQTQSEEWGGHYSILGFVHTFSKLLPVEKYFKDHPEWYSDPDNGFKPATSASQMPAPQKTQLCFSAPGVLEELSKNALAWIEKNSEAGYISISQNDSRDSMCRDEAALKLTEEEGSASAPLLQFVNQVAANIHEKYPDFKVETLAYFETEAPPKTIRPAKNVVVRMAPIGTDYGHPINSEQNAKARDNLLAWSKIAPDIFVWNYVTNFGRTMFPHPNWNGLDDDLRFFVAHNVQGVFEQGDAYTNGTGDFVQLRDWLVGKLMWNPDLDQEKLTDEFLRGYYGAAAPHLKAYLATIQKSFDARNKRLSISNNDFSFMDLDTTNDAIQAFDAAAKAVQSDEVLSSRVRRARLPLDIVTLQNYRTLQRVAARENKTFLGPKDPSAAMQDYITTAKKFGASLWGEGVTFDSVLPQLEGMYPPGAPPAPLPEWAQKLPAADVIDLQQDQFRLYRVGELSGVADDPESSDGKVVTVIGDTIEWAIQAPLSLLTGEDNTKWRIFVLARADTTEGATKTGTGFRAGLYDPNTKKSTDTAAVPLEKVAGGKYQSVDLGAHELNSGMFVWFAPTKNPAVSRIFVDRIILIRES
jgi:hypothetical protein